MKIRDPDHMEKVKRFYSRFPSYNLTRYPYFINIYSLFARCQAEIFEKGIFGGPFTHCLDVGCGTGSHTLYAARFCTRVTGIDVSAESIRKAEQTAREQQITNITFICGDVAAGCLPAETFDCVTCYGDVLGHIPDYEKALSEISRATKRGGLFSFDIDNKWYPGLLIHPEERRRALTNLREGTTRTWTFEGENLEFNTFTQREITQLLASYHFRILRTYGFDFFTYLMPERCQFSTRIGWKERVSLFLGTIDIALRRIWPINRFGYTKVIFARKEDR